MTDTIRHRGPNSGGRERQEFVDVGFRRLAIIDLGGGDQPLCNEDASVACFLNGEVFNYRRLREELQRRGHVFRTDSDTEVLPHLYEEYGDGMFAHLNGMFVIVVVDRVRKEVLLARDHVGVKQLYLAELPGAVVFCSEVKGALASGLIEPEVDRASVLSYLTLFYCPGPHTLIRGLRKLPPGSFVRLSGGSMEGPRSYWELRPEPRTISLADAVEGTREHLKSAVELQLHADVPVGLSLSGGVDSSAIAMAASLGGHCDLTAFTVMFDGTPPEESRCAREVAAALGIRHTELRPQIGDVGAELPLLAWISDEPVADPATYAQYCIARAASEHVTVLLSGAGGDELFAGYSSYFRSRKQAVYAASPALVRGVLRRMISGSNRSEELAEALAAFDESPFLMHCRAMSSLDRSERREIAAHTGGSRDPFGTFRRLFERFAGMGSVTQQSSVDLLTYLPDQVLPMLDRATMAASIEGRVPLLDIGLVEFAMSLPESVKVGRPAVAKRLLKAAIRDRLPASVIGRSKVGMPSPVFGLLAAGRESVFRKVLCAPDSFVSSLLPVGWISARVASDEAARRYFRVLYSLLALEVWHRLFIRERAYSRPDLTLHDLFRIPERLPA